MTEIYFHCSDAEHVVIDRCGSAVDDLAEAHAQAHRFVRALIMTPSTEDWRDWILHATDERGEELFVVPFASILGKLH